MIDTHSHIDAPEFDEDREQAILRAREAGIERILVPAISLGSMAGIMDVCRRHPGYAQPMIGLHPEEVKKGWVEELSKLRQMLDDNLQNAPATERFVAIGEVGLDYYWSREFADDQLKVFEEQVKWSIETRLPLMIHCRKAQNEMVNMMRKYIDDLPGGVFHCFTGNLTEARQLLQFPRFCLGIGGVLTFKKSHLPEVLPELPLDRIVLETDCPYMAPVPMRGKRNESAFITYVMRRMAECYSIPETEVERITDANVCRIFGTAPKP